MKSKIHLIYGIVIGILLCACFGFSTADQKEFKEVHLVQYYDVSKTLKEGEDADGVYKDYPKEFLSEGEHQFGKWKMVSGFKIFMSHWKEPHAWIVPGYTANDIRKAGWTIMDMEFPPYAKDDKYPYFLIGK